MDTPWQTLYERLGGIYNIATVVDQFIDRIESWLTPGSTQIPASTKPITPCRRPGSSTWSPKYRWSAKRPVGHSLTPVATMEDSHRHLMITGDEWEAFID
jgi:hemoglobin